MKKVLMISYYWPPAGGVSVLRTLKIAKYLRDYGWEPIIFTTSNAAYPYIDEGNLNDVPEGIEVIKCPILEPFELFKKISGRKKEERLDNILQVRSKNSNFFESFGIWVRANFFIPDARSFWIRPSIRYLKNYLKYNPVHAIFSDGPPHTNTVIANKISQHFSIPWLADFQDPWTQADYYELFSIGKIADKIHRNMEQSVFKNANKITIASPSWAIDLERIGAKSVDTVYYGYDESDFTDLSNQEFDKITITHAGLLGIDRLPENFLIALKDEINSNPTIQERITLKLVGQVDWKIKNKITELNLDKICIYKDFVPRKEVLQMNKSAHLLLLPLNQANNSKGRLPGKLYEYIRSGTPILSFGDIDSDAAKILSKTGCGKTINYEDIESASQVIHELLENRTINSFKPNKRVIEGYSNQKQTRKIAQFLNSITK